MFEGSMSEDAGACIQKWFLARQVAVYPNVHFPATSRATNWGLVESPQAEIRRVVHVEV
jgi:hypothetical protein